MSRTNRNLHVRFGQSAMVCAAHPLAVIAGLDALREGGSAMDACIAMAGVTSVVLPHMCGLGGDAFFIYFDAVKNEVTALNGSGFTGDLATVSFFQNLGMQSIMPQDGLLSVAVPGAPLIYELGLKAYGNFSLEKAFGPGVSLAEEGFTVTPGFARALANGQAKFGKCPEASRVFLSSGQAPKAGERFRAPDLAKTLMEFGRFGAEYIYKGTFAEKFYRLSDEAGESGSTFSGGEFDRFYRQPPAFYTPLSIDYRGNTIYQTAPVSQGFLMLEQMKIIENFDLPSLEPGSSEAIHLMAEAKKLAFRDRNLYAGDPLFSGFNAHEFISAGHGQRLASVIDSAKVISKAELGPGGVGPENQGDTASFVAVDCEGNACSFIHSNAFSFGSGVVVPGTGVILNNRAGRSFVLEKDHPNCVSPGKKPMHTLNCYMVFADGDFFIAGGTPGGDGQPQWNMQMLSLMLDHGYGPQEACDFPRWLSFPGTDVLHLDRSLELRVESGFLPETVLSLTKLGHTVRTIRPWAGGGGAQIIMLDPDSGLLIGGSDRRLEGLALGF